ncbi:hypothetical protein ACFX1R_040896 [Malus domestica]
MKSSGGAYLDLLSAGRSHRLGLHQAFPDLLLAFCGDSAVALDFDGVGGVVVVIPLIGPRGLVIRFVSVHDRSRKVEAGINRRKNSIDWGG